MHLKHFFRITTAVVLLSTFPFGSHAAQGKLADAKGLRCTFALGATGTWKKDGTPEAALGPSKLVLLFDAINVDEGTAQLKNGTVGTEIIVRSSEGYLNLIQSFRTGPLYTTTVFEKDKVGGKLKAVHSRHEYFTVPLAGSTSSPEQYYGECEVTR